MRTSYLLPFLSRPCFFFFFSFLKWLCVIQRLGVIQSSFTPPPPEIPELPQPLMLDEHRRRELAVGLGVQFLGRNTFSDLTHQMEILEMRMLLERRIEAALIGDGYRDTDLIRKRFEVRDVLFYNKNGRPFSKQTLRSYLSQIGNNGTRGSVPYRKVVNAIRKSDICL